MNGRFSRKSPAEFAEKLGIPVGWIVISHRYMPDRVSRRHAHGRWYKVSSEHGNIFRILRFSANLPGTADSPGEMVVDWPGWLDLHGRAEVVTQPLDLKISKVSWWAYPKMALAHPDPTVRLAGELGLLSVALGLLSIVLALK